VNFSDGKGASLTLSVVGYQFPGETSERSDANWLVISGKAKHLRGAWDFQDACLTTFELNQLADWFDGAAAGHPEPDSGYFTEPCLEFRYKADPEPTLDVRLAYECAPPWLGDSDARMDGITLRFPVSSNDLARAAGAARALLRRFPERGLVEGAG